MDVNKKQLMDLPSLDKYSSRKEWELGCWMKILKSEELLELLMTSHERHNLVMRAAVLKELLLGKGIREISRKFFISLQTISVIKKSITENSYRSYSERSKKERKKKEYSVFQAPARPKRRGWPRRTKYGTIYMPY
jgi:Trp operon repressor